MRPLFGDKEYSCRYRALKTGVLSCGKNLQADIFVDHLAIPSKLQSDYVVKD